MEYFCFVGDITVTPSLQENLSSEFLNQMDSNQLHVQRTSYTMLNFACGKISCDTYQRANKKGTGQTACLSAHLLFAGFSRHGPYDTIL